MSTSFSPKAIELAKFFLEKKASDGSNSASLKSQMEHRISLVKYWDIPAGSRVLEIGCGQGDCTIALADAVGNEGHVDAIDPGAPDYGAPFTLSQAQAFILSSSIGSRVNFFNATIQEYLATYQGPAYDFVLMSHCLWYFETPQILADIVSTLSRNPATASATFCLAEWSLRASTSLAQPHVLVALLLCVTESLRKVPGHGNVRTVLSPAQIKDTVVENGFVIDKEEMVIAHEGLRDPWWEVKDCLRGRKSVLAALKDEVGAKQLGAMTAMYDSLQAAVDVLPHGVDDVKPMDVWIARFKKA